MKHTYFLVIIALLFSSTSIGQKILTTNSGQRILLVDDGSWRLLSETELVNGDHSESGTSLDSFKSPKQGKYPISLDQRERVKDMLTTLKSDEAQLIVNIEMAKRKMSQLIDDKNELKKNKGNTDKITHQIAETKETIKKDEKYYKEASKLIEVSKRLLDGQVKNREKALASIEVKSNSIEDLNSGMGGTLNTSPEVINEEKNQTASSIGYPTTFEIDETKGAEKDQDCEIIFDGYDKNLGTDRREVKAAPFFSYSQEKMKPYFKSEDYLKCDGSISKVGKKYYLTLKIRIRSKDASKTYGTLRTNERIKLQLIDGSSVYGVSVNNDEGQIESYTGHTLYTGIFEIAKGDVKVLKKNYLDNIGIIWSSGYEQYDIYNVDFLKNQIQCLNK